MKKAALRYAELLENGFFITQHEQDDIAKLLRKLVMTENEAWDELERKQSKKIKPLSEREALQLAWNALDLIDNQTPYPAAKHALKVISSVLDVPAQDWQAIAADQAMTIAMLRQDNKQKSSSEKQMGDNWSGKFKGRAE